MSNEILEEVWRNRDAIARRCHYKISELATALRELERVERRPVVDRSHGGGRKGPARASALVRTPTSCGGKPSRKSAWTARQAPRAAAPSTTP